MEVILAVDNQLDWNYVKVITQIKGEVMAGACLGVNEQNRSLLNKPKKTFLALQYQQLSTLIA